MCLLFMGLHENKKQFQWTPAWNSALHAWKIDLWYLSEFFLFFEIWMYPTYRKHRLINWAATCDFQQYGILTSVDSEGPVQSAFKPTNSKRCSVSSLTLRIFTRLAKALIRLCICTGWSEALLFPHTSLLEISCHGSIILFRGIGRKVGRSLTW